MNTGSTRKNGDRSIAGGCGLTIGSWSGSEFYASAMVNAAEEVVFTVNHRTDVTTEMLVEYGGKFYDIKRIDNYEGYTDDISLYCKLSNDQNIEVTEPDAASV